METKVLVENVSLQLKCWLALHEALRGDGQFGQRLGVVVVGGHDGVMALPLRIDMAVVHEIDQQVLPRRFRRCKPTSFCSEPEITCSASASAYS